MTLAMFVFDSPMTMAQTCTEPEANCQQRDHWNALASDGVEHTVADNFSPQATGSIDQVCWWGTYLNGETECEPGKADAFEITYYTNGDGSPGAVLAGPFRHSRGTLSVTGPTPTQDTLLDAIPEYEYHASHAPVSVTAGVCYWIEIRNTRSDGCSWYWEVAESVDRIAAQDGSLTSADGFDIFDLLPTDMAFCLDVAIGAPVVCGRPANDEWCDRIPIDEGEHFFSNIYASSSDQNSYLYDCEFTTLGDSGVHRDIWYEYTPSCTALAVLDVCESNYNAKFAMFYQSYSCLVYTQPLGCNGGCGLEPGEPVATYESPNGPIEEFDERCFSIVHAVAPYRCLAKEVVTDYCVDLARKLCRQPDSFQSELAVLVEAGRPYAIRPGSFQSELVVLVEAGRPYDIRLGGHASDDGRDFAEDPRCVGRVCGLYPTCCSDTGEFSCPWVAAYECIGDTGSGILRVNLKAIPPVHTNLRHVSEFLTCFSGSCSAPPCDPPIYPEPCCLTQDFDNDGDVDVNDLAIHLAPSMTGP